MVLDAANSGRQRRGSTSTLHASASPPEPRRGASHDGDRPPGCGVHGVLRRLVTLRAQSSVTDSVRSTCRTSLDGMRTVFQVARYAPTSSLRECRPLRLPTGCPPAGARPSGTHPPVPARLAPGIPGSPGASHRPPRPIRLAHGAPPARLRPPPPVLARLGHLRPSGRSCRRFLRPPARRGGGAAGGSFAVPVPTSGPVAASSCVRSDTMSPAAPGERPRCSAMRQRAADQFDNERSAGPTPLWQRPGAPQDDACQAGASA